MRQAIEEATKFFEAKSGNTTFQSHGRFGKSEPASG